MSAPKSALRLSSSLRDHVLTYALLALLAVMILVWTVLVLLLLSWWPPRPRRVATRAAICYGFRMFAWALGGSGAYKLDLSALDRLREGPPLVLAPNHPTLIDAVLILTRHPNLVCVLKPELMSNFFLGTGARLARYIRGHPPRSMIKQAIAELEDGGVLLLFPEGTRTVRSPVNRLTASVGVIAKHARVPVQAAIIETDSPYLAKGWSLFRVPRLPITYRVRLGARIEPPSDAEVCMAELQREYAAQLAGAAQAEWLGELSHPADPQPAHPR